MKDMVTNGTGNSRYLKTSLASGTTWESALAMLREGTFPIDLNGLNNGGITQLGSAYSKANVLPDDVCALLGLNSTTAEPKDAFGVVANPAELWVWEKKNASTLAHIGYVVSTSSTTYPEDGQQGDYRYTRLGQIGGAARIETGSYVGTGTYGSSTPNSLTFGFDPMVVFLSPEVPNRNSSFITALKGNTSALDANTGYNINISWGIKTMSWSSGKDEYVQYNKSGMRYFYVAIG